MGHGYSDLLVHLADGIEALDRREELTRDDVVQLWIDTADLAALLDVVLSQLTSEASLIVADLLAEAGQSPRADYATKRGDVVHLQRRTAREKWRGYDLLGALAINVHDMNTGEAVRAVPLDVARRAVAGCRTPELTSSRWSVTGVGVELTRRYRTQEEQPDRITLGERNPHPRR